MARLRPQPRLAAAEARLVDRIALGKNGRRRLNSSRTILNGEKVQDWNTSDMIFDVRAIIEFLSGSTTLLPGTIILTGTPQGIGMAATPPRWLKPGDSVTIEIERIGQLTNPVEIESA